jgi:hypothetical protein
MTICQYCHGSGWVQVETTAGDGWFGCPDCTPKPPFQRETVSVDPSQCRPEARVIGTTIDIVALRKIAEAASPGPWLVGKPGGRPGYNIYDSHDCDVTHPDARIHMDNAIHIASFNPKVALELIAYIETLCAGVVRIRDDLVSVYGPIAAVEAIDRVIKAKQ